MIALREASITATDQAGVLVSGTIATSASMKSGWLTPHCSACMPPIDGPITATTWSMPSFSFSSRYCDSTMSRMANFGKLHARLRLGIARRRGEAVADRIGADDEILVGVERLAGPDHEIEPMMIAGDRRHHQDGVGLARVQRAVGDVGDREIPDRLAALQLEVAFVEQLVRRLLRRVGKAGSDSNSEARPRRTRAVHLIISLPWSMFFFSARIEAARRTTRASVSKLPMQTTE